MTGDRSRGRPPAQIVAESLGGLLVMGKQYPAPLPGALQEWYCYTRDGGHSIVVVLSSAAEHDGGDVEDYLVPAPVKAVLRAGVVERDGYLWCDLPYDKDLGLLCEDDAEY